MKKKVYVASSWRNEHQQTLVNELRLMGHEVYDFKHPNGEAGFKWSNMDENWQGWTMEQYRENLESDYAQFGFNRDFDAMKAADICILCLPCGRSAHLEAGWMKGAGKRVIAYIHAGDRIEPELMYGILDGIALSVQEVGKMIEKRKYVEEVDSVWHPMNMDMPCVTTDVELMKPDHSIVKGKIVVEVSGYFIYLCPGWGSIDNYTHWRFQKGE